VGWFDGAWSSAARARARSILGDPGAAMQADMTSRSSSGGFPALRTVDPSRAAWPSISSSM